VFQQWHLHSFQKMFCQVKLDKMSAKVSLHSSENRSKNLLPEWQSAQVILLGKKKRRQMNNWWSTYSKSLEQCFDRIYHKTSHCSWQLSFRNRRMMNAMQDWIFLGNNWTVNDWKISIMIKYMNIFVDIIDE